MKTKTVLLPVVILTLAILLSACSQGKEEPDLIVPDRIIADFDDCPGASPLNNLGGAMGAAYNPPDSLVESFPAESGRGCIARLEFDNQAWSAFWQKLNEADFTEFKNGELTFDVRAEPSPDLPREFKIELKRAGGEIEVAYVSGISEEWQTVRLPLGDFKSPGFGSPLSGLTQMQELVFVFEHDRSGPKGVVLIDDIILKR